MFGTLSETTPPIEDVSRRRRSRRASRRVMKEPVQAPRRLQPDAAEQLEALPRQRQGHLPREPAALFFTTFRINRLSQEGGVIVGGDGGNHVSFTLMRTDTGGEEYEKAGCARRRTASAWKRPEVLESVDEFGDGITIQILAVFPGFVLQQIMNCLAVRQVVPRGVGRTELVWTCFGYADDDETMTERRLRQANLVGPAGFISMEDGAATGFVQRGVAGAPDRASVVEMGGRGVGSDESRVTETCVRGFWQAYRRHMGL